eukprot:11068210-Alexandrium_andersonii.AAC.1
MGSPKHGTEAYFKKLSETKLAKSAKRIAKTVQKPAVQHVLKKTRAKDCEAADGICLQWRVRCGKLVGNGRTP